MSFCPQKRAVIEPALSGSPRFWADLRLHQSGFAGITARTNMAAETLDARIALFSTEQLNDAANDSGGAQLPIAYFVSTQ
jgi:hypothetical protein